ncbi:MAG: patatin-like phospholipase family protein [candidate division KSB1 bacterium]|nr:patatin-like phospholipase family protein [candidate division KSB1 bacterium]
MRPKIGLALSGGGLRGIAQIGVLQVLEQEDIPVDVIVGTSIGGVIGGLYASGYSPSDLLEMARTVDWGSVLSDAPQRSNLFLSEKEKHGRALLKFRIENGNLVVPDALTPGQKITQIFTELILNAPIHGDSFDRLRCSLVIAATDMLTGSQVLLKQGDLAQAMRATIALPLLFAPVELGQSLLVDGGVVSNIPVNETRGAGADLVIAVDTTSPLRPRDEINAPWEIADQITTIMQQEQNRRQLELADIVVSFADVASHSSNYAAMESLFQEGVNRMREQIPKIRRLLVQRSFAERDSIVLIDEIKWANPASRAQEEIERDFPFSTSMSEINYLLHRLFASGDYERLSADLVRKDEHTVLIIHAEENPILKDIVIYGASIFPQDSLKNAFAEALGRPYSSRRMENAVARLLTQYREKGFSLTRIDRVVFDKEQGIAAVYLSEGLIHELSITGLKKTKRYVVDRELAVHQGEFFRLDRARTSLENIFASGLFRAVNLYVNSRENLHRVEFRLQERPSTMLLTGVRVDTDRGAKIFGELADENFNGTGNDLTIHLQYGGKDFKTFIGYTADQIFQSLYTARVNFHHYQSEYFAYEKLRRTGRYLRIASGMDAELGRQIARFGALSALLRMEEIDLDPLGGYGYDTGSLRINTLGFKTVVDTRDQVPFAHSGKHHVFFYEISSGRFLGADISFFKVMNQLSTHNPIGKAWTFSPKIIWGTSDMTTPYSEQFRIGGRSSFPGLYEGQLWGRQMFQAGAELRRECCRLASMPFYLAVQFNTAAAWNRFESVQRSDFITGFAVEAAVKTPAGPLQLTIAKASRQSPMLHFSAGFEF